MGLCVVLLAVYAGTALTAWLQQMSWLRSRSCLSRPCGVIFCKTSSPSAAVLRQTDARRINEPHDQRYRERLRDVESERNPAHFKRTVPGWIACHHAVPERMADAAQHGDHSACHAVHEDRSKPDKEAFLQAAEHAG